MYIIYIIINIYNYGIYLHVLDYLINLNFSIPVFMVYFEI